MCAPWPDLRHRRVRSAPGLNQDLYLNNGAATAAAAPAASGGRARSPMRGTEKPVSRKRVVAYIIHALPVPVGLCARESATHCKRCASSLLESSGGDFGLSTACVCVPCGGSYVTLPVIFVPVVRMYKSGISPQVVFRGLGVLCLRLTI